MKIHIYIATFTLVGATFNLKANQNTVEFLKERSDYYLLDKSGFCHGNLSSKRDSVILINAEDKNVPPINTFETLKDCTNVGGKLTEEEIRRQAIQDTVAVKKNEDIEDSNQNFFGISWGLGLAFTYVDNPIITDLSISEADSGGTIFINHQSQHRAIAMVESHYFRNCWYDLLFGKCSTTRSGDFGHGPFVSIGIVGEDGIDPLSTYGLGWMIGFKRDDKGNSWNIGLGYFVDSKAKKLRPNIQDGDQTTITDINQLTYQRDETGLMVMFSSTF